MELSVLLKSILFDANCIPFTVAFILLMSLLAIEIVGFLVAGMGIFALIDNLMPEIHISLDTSNPANLLASVEGLTDKAKVKKPVRMGVPVPTAVVVDQANHFLDDNK